MWTLFPLKDKHNDKFCVIYEGDCSFGSCYIGETKNNARWDDNLDDKLVMIS